MQSSPHSSTHPKGFGKRGPNEEVFESSKNRSTSRKRNSSHQASIDFTQMSFNCNNIEQLNQQRKDFLQQKLLEFKNKYATISQQYKKPRMMAPTPTVNDPQIMELMHKYPKQSGLAQNNKEEKLVKFEDKIRYVSPQPQRIN